MEPIQITVLTVMAVFYIAYFAKMLLQRRSGVQTNQIAKGSKPKPMRVTDVARSAARIFQRDTSADPAGRTVFARNIRQRIQ